LPAENWDSAFSIAGIKAAIGKRLRTWSSSRKIGGFIEQAGIPPEFLI
jgi:hypothetical protein